MKHLLALLIACHALSARHAIAREPQSPPAPEAADTVTQAGTFKEIPDPNGGPTISLFVGRYGETIKLQYQWTAAPKMSEIRPP